MTEYIADYNESCADCAYHKCNQSCTEQSKCRIKQAQCLYLGKTGIKCSSQRCEYFKKWRFYKDG